MYLLGLQPRQPVADGAHHRGRLRGRRRHRGGGEHLPPSRRRRDSDAGGAQGLARDRVHRAVDQRLAGRGVHSAAADGRHHRPAVPRIRDDGDGLDRGLGLWSPCARRRCCASRFLEREPEHSTAGSIAPSKRVSSACSTRIAAALDVVLRHQRITLGGVPCHGRRDGGDVRHDSERLLSDPGYRPDHRHLGGGAGRLARRDEAAATGARRRSSPRIPTWRRSDRSSAAATATRSTPAASSSG